MASTDNDIDDDTSVPLQPPSEPAEQAKKANKASKAKNVVVTARPGDLTMSWRVVLCLAWIGGFFAFAAVWQASVQIGIGTWWIGPRALPAPPYIRLLPFALTLVMALCVIYNTPRIVRTSFVGTLLVAAIAIPDFSRSVSMAIAELVVAGLLLLVTVGAVSGRYRLQPRGEVDWSPPTAPSPATAPPTDPGSNAPPTE